MLSSLRSSLEIIYLILDLCSLLIVRSHLSGKLDRAPRDVHNTRDFVASWVLLFMSKSVSKIARQVARLMDRVSSPRHRDKAPAPAGLTKEEEDEIVEIFKVSKYKHLVYTSSPMGSRTYSCQTPLCWRDCARIDEKSQNCGYVLTISLHLGCMIVLVQTDSALYIVSRCSSLRLH